MRRRLVTSSAAVAALSLALSPSAARAVERSFPERTITLVTGYGPGGSTDVAARLMADRLGPLLGPNGRVVVENRPGAAGVVASDWLRRQNPDGHTLMLVESGSHAIAPVALVGGTGYRPVEDYTHLGIVGTGPLVLVVNDGFPARTAEEFLARARAAKPEDLAYASSGVGTPNHLATELLALSLGTRFVHVPFRSGGAQVQAIVQGQGQFGIAVLASAAGQVRSGLVRGLALTGNERFPSFPDIPTLTESGLPGFDLETFNTIIGPPDMPAAAVAAINRAIAAALTEPALRERLVAAGVAPWSRANAPADARAFMAREVDKFRAVVERTGVRLER